MNTPKLRFKEFNDTWKKIQLSSFVNINPQNDSLPEKFIYIDLESVNNGLLTSKKIINRSEAPSRAKRTIIKNDILYQTVRPYQMNNLFINSLDSDYPYIASTGYALLRTKENPYFVYSILHQKSFVNKVLDMCTGTSYPAINATDLGKISVGLPSIKEQEKISRTLELLDKKIELQTKKIEDLKLFKKGLIDYIIKNIETEKIPLKNILVEQNYKTTKNNEYEILSSTAKGIYLQKDYFNKQAASDNNIGYKILKKNQLVLSPQNLWMGNININKEYNIGIVSPSYKVFNINDNIDINFFNYWIKSAKALYKYKISSEQGASIVRRNLNMDLFYEIVADIPKGKWQNEIGKIIKLLDLKVQYNENSLQKLLDLKKGLMQNMFV